MKIQTNMKRLLFFVLAMALTLSLLPIYAAAETTGEAPKEIVLYASTELAEQSLQTLLQPARGKLLA